MKLLESIKIIQTRISAKMYSITNMLGANTLRTARGLVMSMLRRVVALYKARKRKRQLSFEYVDFLRSQLAAMERERDIYRDAYLKKSITESDEVADFSQFTPLRTFEPWSEKRKKIEMMMRKKKEEKQKKAANA